MKFLQSLILTLVICSTFQISYGSTTQINMLKIQNDTGWNVTIDTIYNYGKGKINLTTQVIVPAKKYINIIKSGSSSYPVVLEEISFTATTKDGNIVGQHIKKINMNKITLSPHRGTTNYIYIRNY